ncbi:MAG: glycoside hydrolase family 15 protein [Isosphaeraceae bacterium]
MSNLPAMNPEVAALLRPEYDRDQLVTLRGFLQGAGTLDFNPLSTGLFSAAAVTDYSKGTNYHAAWVRDNVHVAYAHFVHGLVRAAARNARALAAFFRTQHARFDAVTSDPALKADSMNRPHIRFNGDTLTEIDQRWAHAQNDALGGFLWLYCLLALHGGTTPDAWAEDLETLARFPAYFRAIEYWADEDNGHWEEAPKVEASSVGVVVAGLRMLRKLSRLLASGGGEHVPPEVAAGFVKAIPPDSLDPLILQGEAALFRILPAECADPDPKKARAYDAALLFLIDPFAVVNEGMADAIAARVERHLRGDHGVKRYLGDSFYCTDYETAMAQSSDDPTRDFSEDMSGRDALLIAGGEAQWCLFDPILSIHHGRRFARTRDPEALRMQTEALNRSLGQITDADPPRCQALRCPELYYKEKGKIQTSKSTPLLWTQANLWRALTAMQRSLEPDLASASRG